MAAAITFDDLPESVRAATIAIAAGIIARVPVDALPAIVRPLARFTPAKRAKHGAAPLSRALATERSFRSLIASHLAAAPDADPITRAARYFLQGRDDLGDVLPAARRVDEVRDLRDRVAGLIDTIEMLSSRLASGAGPAPDVRTEPGPGDSAEAEKLRQRLRKQGVAHRRARDEAEAAVDRAVAARDEAVSSARRWQSQLAATQAQLTAESNRAAAAEAALQHERRESDQQRAAADRRLALLLDTIVDAADGLRREWRLVAGGALPADVAAQGLPPPRSRSARPVDVPVALGWLALPQAHLIVDGYNITKLGYPDLTLAQQRDRLVRAVGGLVSRTGVEATVVFDGAAVVAASASTRAVRVVFSPPGVIADDVVRDMVAAEPRGRVVVVATSDREIVDHVRGRGARVVSAPLFLELL